MIDHKELMYRIVAGAVGAMIIGAGSMLLGTNREVAEHGVHISQIEQRQLAMDALLVHVDQNVNVVNDKVDVVNQKLDDARKALHK